MAKKKTWPIYATAAVAVAAVAYGTHAAGLWGKSAADDVLKIAMATPLTGLDTAVITDGPAINIAGNTQEGLLRNDDKGEPQLALAKSIDSSADGKTWTIKLRDGLKWSDGSALTAKDFVYTWQRVNDPKTASEYAYIFSGIKNADAIQAGKAAPDTLGVKATDDTTLVVTLEKPLPQFKNLLTFPTFYPEQQKFVESKGKSYASSSANQLYSGPYKLEGWNGSNNKFKLVKNDNYWDAKHVKSKEIDVQVVQKAETAVQLYKQGKLDYTILDTPDLVAANSKEKGYQLVPQATTVFNYLNTKNKALANTNIRKALQLATNRTELNQQVLNGLSTPATSFTPKGLYTAADGKDFATYAKQDYTYNKSEAKKYWEAGLKELGVSSVSLTLESDTDRVANAKAVSDYLQSAWQSSLPGLTIKQKNVPFKQRLQDGANGNFDIMLTQWGADYAEPSTYLNMLVTKGTNNWGNYSSAAYDSALDKATGDDAIDATKRDADYKGIENDIFKNAAINPLYFQAQPELLRPNVAGVVENTAGVGLDLKTAYRK